MKLDERIRERLAALIKKGEDVLGTKRPPQSNVLGGRSSVDSERYAEWRNQTVVCLTQVFGSAHIYTASFESQADHRQYASHVTAGLGILCAALEDVEQGHLGTLQDMAAAEVFSDFLEQADYLLKHGYAAPAASLAGAVLENGLRSLATRNDIKVKARDDLSALNNKLAAKNVYTALRRKEVEVWTTVRNSADHGQFHEVTEGNVADLIRGVRNLLAEKM